jgi:TPR repeat protein
MTKHVKRSLVLATLACSLAASRSSRQEQRAAPCPQDANGFARVQQRAHDKDPAAQTTLAFCYDLGRHVEPDGRESIRLLTEAAQQGYAPAQYEIGRIYLYGRGIPADYQKALLWETKAAEQGDSRAQRDLAFMYERGFGVAPDPAQAAEWNRKAAAQGVAEAQVHLGNALDSGAGVPKNSAEARQWYQKAAQQNQPAAQLQLARAYAQDGDCRPAIHWYKQAAANGESQAMLELGKLYLRKKCGADRAEALLWFTIGSRFRLQECKAEADKLAPLLSLAQRKSAQLTAEHWTKTHSGARKDEDEEEEKQR